MSLPTTKPAVLIAALYLKLGGLERMVIQLIQGLVKAGHPVTLVCIEEGGNLIHQLDNTDVDIRILNKPPGFSLNVAFQLLRIAKEKKIGIIHSQNSAPHLYSAFAKLFSLGRIKLIHTKHGRDEPDNKRLVLKNRFASLFSDKVVAVSKDAVEVCETIESVNPKKLLFVPNGIDMSSFGDIDRASQRARVTNGEIRFVTVGRLSVEKNHQFMLAAFAEVHKKHHKSTLSFYGDGALQNDLRAQCQQLGIEHAVKFEGIVENVAEQLEKHDIFLLSSLTEGMPLAVIEAMAAGLPVISTDVGGLSELIDHNQSGLLTPSGDLNSYVNAICTIAEDPSSLARFGDTASLKSRKKYDLMQMVSHYSELYLEIAP